MRGDFPFMDGFRDGLQDAFHPEWMEYTSILSTIALWLVAAALIALTVRAYLNARRTPGQSDETVTRTQGHDHPPVPVVPPEAAPEAPTEPVGQRPPQGPPPVTPEKDTARQVLDQRYAAGEIDRDEYLRRRDDLD